MAPSHEYIDLTEIRTEGDRQAEASESRALTTDLIWNLIHVIDYYPARKEGDVMIVHYPPTRHTRLNNAKSANRNAKTHRWIHIPVNDTAIAEKYVKFLVGEAQSEHLRKSWQQKLRPTRSVRPNSVPSHAWSMEPSVQMHSVTNQIQEEYSNHNYYADNGKMENGKAGFTLFLPYLSWDHFKELQNQRGQSTTDGSRHHQRRTLDEFYYSSLQDTKSRNAGQTVSKWTGPGVPQHGRSEAVDDSLVVMVDQLWVWILDERTLVSCCPTHHLSGKANFLLPSEIDITATVDLERCQDPTDLLAQLATQSITRFFEESSDNLADMLSIYRWAAANKAARHTELLERFWRRQLGTSAEVLAIEGSEELKLTLEVVDILDELNILMLVFENQASVVNELQRKLSSMKSRKGGEVSGPGHGSAFVNMGVNLPGGLFGDSSVEATAQLLYAGNLLEQAAQRLQLEKSNTERLRREVTHTHKLLLELLDLEQKAASLGEARMTTKQGQAIMLFTIVTIIFLPLSFFTSYFGQNVSELTGDTQNPKSKDLWKIAAPISVVVILIALAISFIIYPWKSVKDFVIGKWTSCVQRVKSGRNETLSDGPDENLSSSRSVSSGNTLSC